MLLGRHSDADIRLPTPDVSRRHCQFLCTDGTWEVYDLDSLNGVYVNGERVRQRVLRQGDLVTVGGFRLYVELGEPAEQEQAERLLRSIADALPHADVSEQAA
jgi:pSer/pThr/pTyr-binding forkhead associated (FHA) protein